MYYYETIIFGFKKLAVYAYRYQKFYKIDEFLTETQKCKSALTLMNAKPT